MLRRGGMSGRVLSIYETGRAIEEMNAGEEMHRS